MNIDIIAVGKLKEQYLRNAVEEYTKRLSWYCTLSVFEVKDEMAPADLLRGKERRSSKPKEPAFPSI